MGRQFRSIQVGEGGRRHSLAVHFRRQRTIGRPQVGPKPDPRAAVCVIGRIQLKALKKTLSEDYIDNGLASRLLLCMPPREQKVWNDAGTDSKAAACFGKLVDRLYGLKLPRHGPRVIRVAKAAGKVWERFYNQHAAEQAELTGSLAAVYAKLEGFAAWLALIIEIVKWTQKHTWRPIQTVDAHSLRAGITMARWFDQEAKRVYAVLKESEKSERERELLEWIRRNDGKATPRDLMPSSAEYKTSDEAEKALQELSTNGHGRWRVDPPRGGKGRQSRVFVLSKK